MTTTKRVYGFGADANGVNRTEGNKDMKFILGGKGANLAEMANMGLPVPPGFTITCQACIEYYDSNPAAFPPGLAEEIAEALGVAVALNAGAAMVYSARVLDAVAAHD